MSAPDRKVPQEFATVTLIQYPSLSGHATGFFYLGQDDNQYLITNKHVVDPEEDDVENIRILLRGSSNLADLEYQDISLLSESGGRNWLEHPVDTDADVVAVPLDVDLRNYGNRVFSRENFLPDEIQIGAGQQAMILGYPFKGKS
ncbi:hypothetical protein, partial [Actinoplanes utahensis]